MTTTSIFSEGSPEIKEMLRQAYDYFNSRNIEKLLPLLHQDVEWPNAMEGGIERGVSAVRDYWTRQWQIIDPHVEPVQFVADEVGRVDVTVHQVVLDMNGKLVVDQLVHHLYSFKDGLIVRMRIGKAL
jgi:ketosteroid isomerase-like protein